MKLVSSPCKHALLEQLGIRIIINHLEITKQETTLKSSMVEVPCAVYGASRHVGFECGFLG